MTDTTKKTTLWRCVSANFIDTDPECDVIVLKMQSGGEIYAIACSGPKGMRSNAFVPAVRAAAASLLAATGGTIDVLDQFDTGDQRAN